MAGSAQYTLNIIKLNCYRQDEGDGDEVFLKLKKERIWPLNNKFIRVNEGAHEVNVEIASIDAGATIKIELWDYDFLTPNDKLGVFRMLVNERGGPFTTDLQGNSKDAKYSIDWEVH